ncbi:uncharacterized protein CELE_F58D5.5 [Caenorhabditis elegans]|uniref:Uncharacterized protein n=1 Tax=Caenorhabditis elegans TaxID=6239 RepID=Q9NLD3_CAEEL|nr:Uncharacterized protein CELE_F58D5.5 [Caenorhabditis elegans]CAB70236.2 Uncharacterized protein CELE_F58D5.5 [Caenorhabditis elegans]|eukprot:NP_493046.2 Uncharacterized protein CELE_F58D5.5 [Caenorhabditis elegans]
MNQYSSFSPSSPSSSSRPSGGGGQSSHQTTPKSSGNPRQQQAQPRHRQRKAQSSSPASLAAFASSSVCSSPSARNVPLPPVEWLNQLQVPGQLENSSRPSSSISMTSSASSSTSSLSSSDAPMITMTPRRAAQKEMKPKTDVLGVRVCPLQLIAAIASA